MIWKDRLRVYLGCEFNSEKIREWRNDSRIWQYCRQTSLLLESDHQNWIKSLAGNSKNKMYSIHEDDLGIIGVCGLTNIDYIARHAEFSLYIDPTCQGKGYGEEALWLLTDHGFKAFNLNKIWGETFEHNPAQKMFKKVGYKIIPGHPHHYFKDGSYINSLFAIIYKDEWEG